MVSANPHCADRIIEFADGDRTKAGFVLQDTGKLSVIDINGRQRKLNVRALLCIHAASNRADFTAAWEAIDRRIEALREEIDTDLLWETVEPELASPCALDALCEQYFGESGAEHQSAMLRALAAAPARFRIKGRTVTIRSRAEAEAEARAAEAREQREELRRRAIATLKPLLRRKVADATDVAVESSDVADTVYDFLVRDADNDAAGWLTAVDPARSPRETAWDILDRIGRLPDDADPFLMVAGINPGFSERVESTCAALPSFAGEPGRDPFEGSDAFSIDDEDTEEIDDAITCERLGDTLRIGVHIADVAAFTAKGDLLDRTAAARTCTVYLPHRRVTMFPARLATNLASLCRGRLRPTTSVVADFDAEGALLRWRLCRGQLVVRRRLTYDQADAMLTGDPPDDPLAPTLQAVGRIAERLAAARAAAGAITISRPELKIRVDGDRVDVKVVSGESPSRRMVAEMMILVNRLTAEYAEEHDLPMIYRAQDPPDQPIALPPAYEPVAADRAFRQLRRSRLSLHPQPHAGLGLARYTQASSPIRRYADLVIQRQLHAHLEGRPLPYVREELMAVLSAAQAAEGDIRGLERRATRHYMIRHFAGRPPTESYAAVVISQQPEGVQVELDRLGVRGALATAARIPVGTAITVSTETADPERGILSFREA